MSPGGAGGKGVWGRSGEVYEPEHVDEKDPNYDEAQVLTAKLINALLVDNNCPLSLSEVYF